MDLTLLSDEDLATLRKTTAKQVAIEHINQHARKILINALYGATGNRFFRYYDIRNARGVTMGGQLATRWAERKLNAYLNDVFKTDTDYVIYGDTDSLYLTLKTLTDKFPNKTEDELVDLLDKFMKTKLQPIIDNGYTDLAEYVNAYQQKMFMDREVIATRGFWTAKKKRYALWVKDNEGLRKDKLKIMGIETQSSSTPKAVVNALTKCIKLILTDTEESLQIYVDEFRQEFEQIGYLDLASVTTVNNIAKYSDDEGNAIKGTLGHIKPVLIYNKLSKEHDFDKIEEGEKVAIIPLMKPNKYQVEKIGFPSGSELPIEIRDYCISKLNYHLLWDNMFLKPLMTICDAIKLNPEKTFSIDDFM
ncbi:DNA polymerase [Paraglaciecola Antarctic GD virus 1]|nr:DNA polymerase [Paraglaciecola Antarctic GD virus 1]